MIFVFYLSEHCGGILTLLCIHRVACQMSFTTPLLVSQMEFMKVLFSLYSKYSGIAIGGDVFPGSTLSDHVLRFNNIPQVIHFEFSFLIYHRPPPLQYTGSLV
ncbi:hypothetical protein BHE74_00014518 [Ensete ventricosum]|uniref:Uncharacterized protein n=1 Tax=Ensete ventricosum TaxID=4639 RepID=A0A427B8P5_ENSVE|nr:hypothetical protein B296_00003199 [Ensete ventricosum]RWW77326.1 hypothetical protein BHE74_00014518 [Ensete ventricosum]